MTDNVNVPQINYQGKIFWWHELEGRGGKDSPEPLPFQGGYRDSFFQFKEKGFFKEELRVLKILSKN